MWPHSLLYAQIFGCLPAARADLNSCHRDHKTCTAWNIYSLTFSENNLPCLPLKASDPQGTGWFPGGRAKAVVLEVKLRAELCAWRRRNRCLRREQKVEEAVGRGHSWEGDRVRGCWQPPTLVLSRSGLGFCEARACLKHSRESCPSFHLPMAFFFQSSPCFLNWLICKMPSLNSELITTSKTLKKNGIFTVFHPTWSPTAYCVPNIRAGTENKTQTLPQGLHNLSFNCKGIGPFKPKAWGSALLTWHPGTRSAWDYK